MEFIMYIYSAKLPVKEMKYVRCPSCGGIVFKANSTSIMLSNAYGVGLQELPPHSSYIEYRCHRCKAEYRILFQ